MTNEQVTTVVLKDAEGNVYRLSPEMLERARISAERAREIERLLAEQDTRGFGDGGPIPLDALVRLPISAGSFSSSLVWGINDFDEVRR